MQEVTYASLAQEQDETNLYVSKLPGEFSQIQLNELFGRFGPIVSSRLLTDSSGRSRCSGFVKFGDKDHAQKAMMELHGSCLFNPADPLQIRYANKSGGGAPGNRFNMAPKDSGGPIRNRTNPVNRFNPMAAQPGQQIGGPMGANPYVQNGNKYNAPSYNPYNSSPMDMPNPMGVPSPANVDGAPIPAPTEEMIANCFHHSQGWSLYVSNLGEQHDELMMYKLFSPFGAITSVKAMLDAETGKNKGFGFINMPQYDSAFEAVRLMHGVEVAPGQILCVSFKTNKKNVNRQKVS